MTTVPPRTSSYRKENDLPKNKPSMGSRLRGNDELAIVMLFRYH
jgi:hypothetical protein